MHSCGAVLSVPLLSIARILLTRADHPLAKQLLHIIRESNTVDEMSIIRGKMRKGGGAPSTLLYLSRGAIEGLVGGIGHRSGSSAGAAPFSSRDGSEDRASAQAEQPTALPPGLAHEGGDSAEDLQASVQP